MIPWARKQIAFRQLAVQRATLRRALTQVEINLRPESGAKALRARQELRDQLKLIEEQRKLVEAMESKPKRPWSKLVLGIYDWATKDRFKIE